VEHVGETTEIARGVVVAVKKAADVDVVEDRSLEPDQVAFEPVAGLAHDGLTSLVAGSDTVTGMCPRKSADSRSKQRPRGRGSRQTTCKRCQTPSEVRLAFVSSLHLQDVRLPRVELHVVPPDPPRERCAAQQVAGVEGG